MISADIRIKPFESNRCRPSAAEVLHLQTLDLPFICCSVSIREMANMPS